MPIIQEASERGLGEGNMNNIEILGTGIEDLKRARFIFDYTLISQLLL
jgi:hypothetical protein